MNDLKAWRAAHGKMSQETLARLVETTQPHLSAIENGGANASLELSIRIFKETGICVGKLKNATPQQAKAISGLSGATA